MTTCFGFLLTASLIYLIGVFGVTLLGNVPLNNTLASFSISTATIEEIKI
jgi:uncharacterized membrane protein